MKQVLKPNQRTKKVKEHDDPSHHAPNNNRQKNAYHIGPSGTDDCIGKKLTVTKNL